MPPAASRDVFIIFYDLNTEDKQTAKHILGKILLLKELCPPKVEGRLYFLNSNTQDNTLGFPTIMEYKESGLITESVLSAMETLEVSKQKCNWLHALQLGLQFFNSYSDASYVITFQLILITDFSNTETCNVDQNLIEEFNERDIYLYVIGPDVTIPKTITNYEDVTVAKKSIILKGESNQSLKTAKTVVEQVHNAIISDYVTGLHLVFAYKNHKGLQPWLEPLRFDDLELPTSTVRVVKFEQLLKVGGRDATSDSWKTSGDDTSYAKSDLISGILIDGQVVQIESEDMFKVEGPRSFKIIGFTDKKNVPEYLRYSDTTNIIEKIPNNEDNDLFDYLVAELSAQNKCIIARRVYNANNIPKYVVLFPKAEENHLIMGELLYGGEAEKGLVESASDNQPEEAIIKEEETNATYSVCANFLDSINVTKPDKCQLKVALGPRMSLDYNALSLLELVEKEVLGIDPLRCVPNIQMSDTNLAADKIKELLPERLTIDPKPEVDDDQEFIYDDDDDDDGDAT